MEYFRLFFSMRARLTEEKIRTCLVAGATTGKMKSITGNNKKASPPMVNAF